MVLIGYKKRWSLKRVGDRMHKHIDFEEFVDYLNCRELSETSVKFAHKINSHILQCKECMRMYNAILAFYDVAFNHSLDSGLFNSIENFKMLIKFKIEQNVNIVLDYVANMVYQYNYPMFIGTRGTDFSQGIDHSTVVDEDNGLNTVSIDNNICKIEIDKDDCGCIAPVIFIKDKKDEIVYAGVMKEKDDVFYITIPVSSQEYSVYISTEGCK